LKYLFIKVSTQILSSTAVFKIDYNKKCNDAENSVLPPQK